MKTIESNGGPLIALNKYDLTRWGGIDSLIFFGPSKSSQNDYECLCFEVADVGGMIVGKSSGLDGDIIIIKDPIPTTIVSASANHVYLAQIDSCESDWSSKNLIKFDFEREIEWRDSFDITLKGGEIVFFDSACVESDLRDDTLRTEIEAGFYRCDWAHQSWDGKADMNFIRIVRQA